jgi:C4-dicarboxylate-specific signal transduction histidine kinase
VLRRALALALDVPGHLMVMSNETLRGMVLINLIQNALDAFQSVPDNRTKTIRV